MQTVLKPIVALLPLIFAFAFLVPVISQGMVALGIAAPCPEAMIGSLASASDLSACSGRRCALYQVCTVPRASLSSLLPR